MKIFLINIEQENFQDKVFFRSPTQYNFIIKITKNKTKNKNKNKNKIKKKVVLEQYQQLLIDKIMQKEQLK